ncbi:MAG: rod shape-determining protein MreD [Sedimentisphaerales bacterium]|nr:rod shape-determining protein MreD [Sedimentisphaerales bacterium]
MRWLIFSLVLLVAALLDAGQLLNVIALGSWHTRPSIMIAVLVFASLNTRPQDAIRCSYAAGFAADLVGWTLGPHMICYGIIGTLLSQFSRTLSLQRPLYQAFLVFVSYMLTELPAVWLESWKTGQSRPEIFWITLSTALYSAIAAPVVWLVLKQVWGKMGKRPEGRSRIY